MMKLNEMISNKKYVYFTIFLLTFLLYGNTILNEYALDDAIVITENTFTKQGFKGIDELFSHDSFRGFFGKDKKLVAGGRYRPLSLVTFAIEYSIFGLNPHVSHFLNILLYAFTCLVLYKLLILLLHRNRRIKKPYVVALLSTLIFIAHPVHTEAVANIKGRDEIMVLLFSLLTVLWTYHYIENHKFKFLLAVIFFFTLALFSKENGITFLGIIPLSIYFFSTSRHKKEKGKKRKQPKRNIPYSDTYYRIPWKQLVIVMGSLIIVSIGFLMLRSRILGPSPEEVKELMNNPFLHASPAEKYATIAFTLGYYIKLLFIPHPLTFDYYPYHISLMNWTDIPVLISALLYLFLMVMLIKGLKNKSIISYGIGFYLITISLVSNLFVSVGTFMNERFLFIPSVGFCLILSYLVTEKIPYLIFKGQKHGLKTLHAGSQNKSLSSSEVPNTVSKNQDPVSKVSKISSKSKDEISEDSRIIMIYGLVVMLLFLYSIKVISRNCDWKNDFILFTTDVKVSTNSAKSNTSAGGVLLEKANEMESKAGKRTTIRGASGQTGKDKSGKSGANHTRIERTARGKSGFNKAPKRMKVKPMERTARGKSRKQAKYAGSQPKNANNQSVEPTTNLVHQSVHANNPTGEQASRIGSQSGHINNQAGEPTTNLDHQSVRANNQTGEQASRIGSQSGKASNESGEQSASIDQNVRQANNKYGELTSRMGSQSGQANSQPGEPANRTGSQSGYAANNPGIALNNNTSPEEMRKQAIEYLQKAIRIHPEYYDAWVLLGNARFAHNNNYKGAAECYLEAMRISPFKTLAMNNLHLAIEKIQDVDAKLLLLEQVLRMRPNDFETNYKLGYIYGRYKNDLQQSIHYLKKARQINPDDFRVNKDLGVAYGMMNDYEQSKKYLKDALQLNPDDKQTYKNLGITYRNLGQLDSARYYLERGGESNF